MPAEPWALMAAAQMHAEGRLVQPIADKPEPMKTVTDVMDDDQYDQTWVKSIARKGRTDDQMRALEPDLEAYRLGKDSDLVTYHKKPPAKTEDLTS